jgi:hypothetical protein
MNKDLVDASMANLAPRPSRLRNALLFTAAFCALLAAALAPTIIRASLDDSSGTGFQMALGPHHQVMTTTTVRTSTWPWVEIRAIDDVPGAVASEAWLTDDITPLPTDQTTGSPADFDSGADYVTALLSNIDAANDALPRQLVGGDSALLVVLWTITDCDVLAQHPPSPGNSSPAHVELRTIFNMSRHHPLPGIASPAFSMEALTASDTCP